MSGKTATLAALLSFFAVPAFACRPMEGDVFDDFSSPYLVLAVANVTDVTITRSSAEKSCVEFGYSRSEVLSGTIDANFRVEMCSDEGPITEEDLAETPDPYGFAKGATVLVGVIKAEDGSSNLRYAVRYLAGALSVADSL